MNAKIFKRQNGPVLEGQVLYEVIDAGDFSGGPVTKTRCSQYRGPTLDPNHSYFKVKICFP